MAEKLLRWVGRSLEDLREFPPPVQRVMGFALRQAQGGDKHIDAKPLRGFPGAGVLEIVEDHDGDTFRAVYTVRFSELVYVLHAFQKKSKRGVATPKHELDLVRQRLAQAQIDYERWLREQAEGNEP
jgi:phage-related protein